MSTDTAPDIPALLADLDRLHDAAEPGPWHLSRYSGLISHGNPNDPHDEYPNESPSDDPCTVALHNAYPVLAAAIRERDAEIAALTATEPNAEVKALMEEWGTRKAKCGRYEAVHPKVIHEVVGALNAINARYADWARQMVWWHAHQRQQVGTRTALMNEESRQRRDAEAERDRLREALSWATGFIRCAHGAGVESEYEDMRNALALAAGGPGMFGEFHRLSCAAELAAVERDAARAECERLRAALTRLLALIRDTNDEDPPRSMRMVYLVSGKPEFNAIDAARRALKGGA